jgi:hypothetical protein
LSALDWIERQLSPIKGSYWARAFQALGRLRRSSRSPGNQCGQQAGFRFAVPIPDFASLHPGYGSCWYSPITKRRFTVDADIKSRHTANAVLKQAGIDRKL